MRRFRADDDLLGGIEEAVRAAQPAPRVVIVSFPHNPTTAVATPELMQQLVDLAREREFVLVHDFAYADIAFDGHVPPSVLAADGRARLRRRAVQPDQVLLDGRLAHGLHARPPRRRRGAREAQVLPRLRHLPADPDRLDRRAARGARLPRRGLRDLPAAPRRADLRPRPRRLGRRAAEGDDVRLGADPRAAPRARLARVRGAARARRRRRRQPGHRLRPGRRRARPLRPRRERAADRAGDPLDPQAAAAARALTTSPPLPRPS